jgi:serine/threonine protein kinase
MKIKIIDFGLSEIGLGVDPKATKRSGTPAYMAPEIVEQNENGYSYSVDVWSIGILL